MTDPMQRIIRREQARESKQAQQEGERRTDRSLDEDSQQRGSVVRKMRSSGCHFSRMIWHMRISTYQPWTTRPRGPIASVGIFYLHVLHLPVLIFCFDSPCPILAERSRFSSLARCVSGPLSVLLTAHCTLSSPYSTFIVHTSQLYHQVDITFVPVGPWANPTCPMFNDGIFKPCHHSKQGFCVR